MIKLRKTTPAGLLCICLSSLALSTGLIGSLASSAEAALIIRNDFAGNGTLRIYLEEQFGGARVDRIECTGSVLSGEDSSPTANAYAKLNSWTASGCTAYQGSKSFGTAYVSFPNLATLPPVEATSTTKVKVRPPTSEPFKVWIEYFRNGSHCAAQLEMGSPNTYTYSTDSSNNRLSAHVSEFFNEPGPFDNCLSAGTATFEATITFPKNQFELFDSNNPPPTGVTVTTGAATTTSTTAKIQGTTTSHGIESIWVFQYWLTGGSHTDVPPSNGSVWPGVHNHSYTITGLKPDTTYNYRLLAWDGSAWQSGGNKTFTTDAWSIMSTPNVSEASFNSLISVDCEPSSLDLCMAVGKTTVSGVDKPMAELWDGYGWVLAPPLLPAGASGGWLEGVTCPSVTDCTAVGFFTTASGKYSLVEKWNGVSWAIQPSPNPQESNHTVLTGVSCPAGTSNCSAVGYTYIGGVQTAVVQRWNGTAWVLEGVSLPSGASASRFSSVECRFVSFMKSCMAVGYYTDANGDTRGLSAEYIGGNWSLRVVPDSPESKVDVLNDVSCSSAATFICTAVGRTQKEVPPETSSPFQTLTMRWNGTAWSAQNSPNPKDWNLFEGVSCTYADSNPYPCVAVGYQFDLSGPTKMLGSRWNGSDWLPEDYVEPAGASFSALGDVVCRGITCIGVGNSKKSVFGTATTLAERFEPSYLAPTVELKPAMSVEQATATLNGDITPNGLPTQYTFEYGLTDDYGASMPVSGGSLNANLNLTQSVSQVLSGLQPETTYHYRLVATNAEGATEGEDHTFTTSGWGIVPTPAPAGASDSNLYDVSCEPSTSVCTAVGKSTVSGADSPVAQRWNGTSWSEQSAAKKSGTLPTRLFGVDCPSETRCLAAGNYQPTEGGPTLLAEIWNEGKWSVYSPPIPAGATSSELVAIGCNSTAQCRAAGSAVIGGVKTAIIEAWTSPNWTLMTVPIPEGASSSQLDGIDCIWSSVCVAVGRYTTSGGAVKKLAMLWDGTNWSLQSLTDPEGAVQSTLLDVSCTKSPTRCTAVGGWKNSVGEQFTLVYRFNGSTWTLQSTPNPSGSIASVFQEVSCATETSCTAAGSWVGGGVSNRTLTAAWNGTSWSIQVTPNPSGAIFSAFFGVSCQSTTCMGVGWSTDGSGVDTTLAETSDLGQPPTITTKPAFSSSRTKTTLKGTVNPNGSETTYQFEYGTTTGYGSKAPVSPKSIGSGTSPAEVSEKIEGLAPETTYHFRLVATNSKGTTKGPDQTFTTPSWEILSTPNPSGASDTNLYDVSCEPSTSVCTSVGKSTVSGADNPVAQRWNGTSWSEQSAAKKSGSAHNRLLGVDCPSETRCIAVGNYQNSEGGPATLGELWNEGKWNVQTTPVPSEASSSELVAVGCNSTATCEGVGSAVIKGVRTAIAERWTSPTWALQAVPIPAEATSSQLDGVDCLWSTFCVAVGRYTSGGATKSLVMFWNGSWSLQTVTDPEGAIQSTLLDVSCTPTPNRCTAVGGWKNAAGEQFTLAYRFNGSSTWTLQSTPNPSGSTESVFQDVSCATETSCTAVGSQLGGGSTLTLAETWNGTSWSIQGTSNPAGATFSSLLGVSCRSTTCMGVGSSTDGSGVDTTLGEIRE